MKTVGKAVVGASIALAVMMSGANAQIMRGGHKHQSSAASQTEKTKTDEKASTQTAGTLLDKSYDPWSKLR